MNFLIWKKSQTRLHDGTRASSVKRHKPDAYLFWSLLAIGTLGSLVIVHRWTQVENKQAVINVQKDQISRSKATIDSLRKSASRLEDSGIAWEKLIREQMDYARPNELIFEFASPGRQGRQQNQ